MKRLKLCHNMNGNAYNPSNYLLFLGMEYEGNPKHHILMPMALTKGPTLPPHKYLHRYGYSYFVVTPPIILSTTHHTHLYSFKYLRAFFWT